MPLKSYPRVYFELVLVGFILIMGMGLSSSFLPIFAEELDPSGILVGLVVSAWFFSRIFMEIPSGILSDKVGRRKLLIGGLFLSAIGSLLCSVASSIYLLIAGRIFWGLGTALYFMSSTALMFDFFDVHIRGQAIGTFQAIEFIGSFIGAPLGGFVAGSIGYRSVFSLAFTCMLGSFSIAFTSRSLRQNSGKSVASKTPSARSILHILRSWSLIVVCVISFSRMFLVSGIISTIFPLYLNSHLGISVELIGVVLSMRTFGHIVATATCGYLSDRFGRKPLIFAGLLVQSICLYTYLQATFFEMLVVTGFFDGLGIGMTFTSLIVLLSEVAPTYLRGGTIGLYRTFMDIGGFLGPLIFLPLYDLCSPHLAFTVAIAVLALNMGLITTVKTRSNS